MSENKVSMFKIAATYIGTIVGAGFASGQEMLQFFSVFGNKGLLGLVIVTILFVLFGYIIMELGRKHSATSHLAIIKTSGGKFIGTFVDFIITFFLFGALTAMIAGSGAMFSQQFHIPAIWGGLLMAVITAITVLTGINGVINSISFIVPFLLVSALGVSISSIFLTPAGPNYAQVSVQTRGLVGNWLWAAILYVSYNTVLAIAVLGPLGVKAKDTKSIRYGALLGGLGLGVGSAAIYFAMTRNIGNLANIEIPMAYIAGQLSYIIQIVYIVVLIAEVYTTAVGSLYGFTARFTGMKVLNGKVLVIGATILAFIASQFGFSNLVKYLYPIVGYGGIVMLLSLLYSKYKSNVSRGRFS